MHVHFVDTYSKAALQVAEYQIPTSCPIIASVQDRASMPEKIIHALPYLPAIDETQLVMAETKDNFLERVFSLARWQQSVAGPISVSRLNDFHMTHRFNAGSTQ